MFNHLLITLLFLSVNTWGSLVYVKSLPDLAMLLSILNITGPMLCLSLDPAMHCTNVLFSVLQNIKNM